MWYDQTEWVGICKYWFRESQTKEISTCFIGHNFVMTCPILMGFLQNGTNWMEKCQVKN